MRANSFATDYGKIRTKGGGGVIYRNARLQIEEGGRESVPGCESDFPYAAIAHRMDNFVGRQVPWHWHEAFEFVIVEKGALEYATRAGAFVMHPGDGCLINAGALHRCNAHGGAPGVEYTVQQFGREAIAGPGWVQRRCVAPVAGCAALEHMLFPGESASGREIVAQMQAAFDAARQEMEAFELEICARLAWAWRRISALARPAVSGEAQPRPESARVKRMLAFMRDHYDQELSLAKIAAAAGVCAREATRCFRRELNATPAAYLAQMRVRKAAQLLRETDRTVTDIALSCGFSTPGYFGKVFCRHMNASPLQYRKG